MVLAYNQFERPPINLIETPDPTALANTGWLYTNDVAARTELMYMDDTGAEIQITSAGALNGAAIGFGAAAANRVVVTDAAGLATTDADLIYNATTNVLTLAGSIQNASGTVSAPSYSFSAASGTGLWFSSSYLRMSGAYSGAVSAFAFGVGFGSPSFQMAAGGAVGWSSTTDAAGSADLVLVRDAANTLAQLNGTNAQAFRVYNTFTDASNFERCLVGFDGFNIFRVETGQSGTGLSRGMRLGPGGPAGAGIVGLQVNTDLTKAQTSGTEVGVSIIGTWNPSSASTMTAVPLRVAPTFNYAAAGAGSARCIYVAPTNTALPTGNNGAIVLSSAAALSTGLNGIQLFNTSDEITNTERGVLRFASNVLELVALAAGSGTVRGLNLAASGGSLGFYGTTPVTQRVGGVTLTNNVTVGGTTNQLDDFTSLTVYATDAAAIRNDIYQLGRKVKLLADAVRTLGLLQNADV